MKKFFILSALVFVVASLGCQTTRYQRLGSTPAGGYSEKLMSQNTFFIKFSASNHTSPEVVRRYLYRRAAEVTVRHGFTYFALIRGPSSLTERMRFDASQDSYDDRAAPIEVDVPQANRLQMVIQCFREMPEQSDIHPVNAKEYLEKRVRPKLNSGS